MEITIDWHGDNFNVNLHSKPGAKPFLQIKGCRIVQGKDGAFISYPAKKLDSGKYWKHVYGGEMFNDAVLKKAQERQAKKPSHDAAKARLLAPKGSGFDDMEADIPF